MIRCICVIYAISVLHIRAFAPSRILRWDKSLQLQMTTPSVWTVFADIATQTNSSNLGQGYPDWKPPQFVQDALRDAVDTNCHQYTRPAGDTALVSLLASRYSRHLDRKIDALKEVAITVGASQALFLSLTAFLKPEDEVVVFEPFFELYLKQITLTGASVKFVSLNYDDLNPWSFHIDDLRSAVSDKTKMIILNSPHNPTGKVFTLSELESIARVVRDNPKLIVISDEVYKYSIYNPPERGDPSAFGHYHFARLPDMYERTITLSSCGKTFSVTGWQIGWIVGPTKYIEQIHQLLPCVQFCAPTPMQKALVKVLQKAEEPYMGYSSYYEWMRQQFLSKKMILESGLRAAGIEPIRSQGGFFLMGRLPDTGAVAAAVIDSGESRVVPDTEALLVPDTIETMASVPCPLEEDFEVDDIDIYSKMMESDDGNGAGKREPYDWMFCRELAKKYRVIGIPATPFISDDSLASKKYPPMARFAFCKKDSTLKEAAKRLGACE